MKRKRKQKEKHYPHRQETLEIIENQFGNKIFGKGEYPCWKCKVVLKFKKTWINHMQKRHQDFSIKKMNCYNDTTISATGKISKQQ